MTEEICYPILDQCKCEMLVCIVKTLFITLEVINLTDLIIATP